MIPPDWGKLRRSKCDQFFFKHHRNNPLLKPTGIQIATKSLPGPTTREHRKLIGVKMMSLCTNYIFYCLEKSDPKTFSSMVPKGVTRRHGEVQQCYRAIIISKHICWKTVPRPGAYQGTDALYPCLPTVVVMHHQVEVRW